MSAKKQEPFSMIGAGARLTWDEMKRLVVEEVVEEVRDDVVVENE